MRLLWGDRHVMKLFRDFIRNEEGLELIEYAILAALIVLASSGAIGCMGWSLRNLYERIGEAFPED